MGFDILESESIDSGVEKVLARKECVSERGCRRCYVTDHMLLPDLPERRPRRDIHDQFGNREE